MQFTRRRALALLVLTSILLLTLDARGNPYIDKARGVFAKVFSPLKGVGEMIATPIRNAWDGAFEIDRLRKERDRLEEELAQANGDSVAAQAALRDYQELVAQLNIPSLADFSNVTAQVLRYSATNSELTIEINAGTSKGVQEGMPVVTSFGLIGKVYKAYDDSAVVLLLNDPSYSVTVRITGIQSLPGASTTTTLGPPATGADGLPIEEAPAGIGTADTVPTDVVPETGTTIAGEPTDTVSPFPPGMTAEEVLTAATDPANTTTTTVAPTTTGPATTTTIDVSKLPLRERGSLEGRGSALRPVIRFLTNDNRTRQIKVGDVVTTDGGRESLAPAGLNIGVVAKVTPRAGTAGPEIEVEPGADLSNINFVRVVLYLPEAPPTDGEG